MKNEVGFQGFLCPQKRGKVKIEFCAKQCPDPCYSLPELLAFSDSRPIVDREYSVTEILRPAQQFYLMRHTPFWVDPKSAIWMTFGSGWHGVIEGQKDKLAELGLADDYIIEKQFYLTAPTSRGDVRLGGRLDLCVVPRKELWDFKTIKAFKVKMMKQNTPASWKQEQYYQQTNFYRALFFPEAEKIYLECVIKDWSEQTLIKDGLHPIERLSVPIGDTEQIKLQAMSRVQEYAGYDLGGEPLPPCRSDELWLDRDGSPRRCKTYCSVSEVCPQYKTWKDQHK